jgi:hypothetical protein
MLNDMLAGPGVSNFKPGQWKVPVTERIHDKDFKWEMWTPPSSDAVQKHLHQVAQTDKLSEDDPEWLRHATEVNSLENGVLDRANKRDSATKDRLQLALERFEAFEKESVSFIEDLQRRL